MQNAMMRERMSGSIATRLTGNSVHFVHYTFPHADTANSSQRVFTNSKSDASV